MSKKNSISQLIFCCLFLSGLSSSQETVSEDHNRSKIDPKYHTVEGFVIDKKPNRASRIGDVTVEDEHRSWMNLSDRDAIDRYRLIETQQLDYQDRAQTNGLITVGDLENTNKFVHINDSEQERQRYKSDYNVAHASVASDDQIIDHKHQKRAVFRDNVGYGANYYQREYDKKRLEFARSNEKRFLPFFDNRYLTRYDYEDPINYKLRQQLGALGSNFWDDRYYYQWLRHRYPNYYLRAPSRWPSWIENRRSLPVAPRATGGDISRFLPPVAPPAIATPAPPSISRQNELADPANDQQFPLRGDDRLSSVDDSNINDDDKSKYDTNRQYGTRPQYDQRPSIGNVRPTARPLGVASVDTIPTPPASIESPDYYRRRFAESEADYNNRLARLNYYDRYLRDYYARLGAATTEAERQVIAARWVDPELYRSLNSDANALRSRRLWLESENPTIAASLSSFTDGPYNPEFNPFDPKYPANDVYGLLPRSYWPTHEKSIEFKRDISSRSSSRRSDSFSETLTARNSTSAGRPFWN